VLFACGAAWAKSVPSDYPPCATPATLGLCSMSSDDVRIQPTQALLGMQEVSCKTAHYASMSSSDLQQYWGKHIVPAVAGSGGGIFVTDHHHSIRALQLAKRADPQDRLVVMNVSATIPASTLDEFWSGMLQANLLWLQDDRFHIPMNPNLLPASLSRMVNDPYRSLAWAVRNNGGYGAVDDPFQDFLYAELMRQASVLPLPAVNGSASRLRGGSDSRWTFCQAAPYNDQTCWKTEMQSILAVLGRALSLCQSEAASGLPGWRQGVVDYPNCGNSTSLGQA
jgi:hypothetical protein